MNIQKINHVVGPIWLANEWSLRNSDDQRALHTDDRHFVYIENNEGSFCHLIFWGRQL